MISPKIIKKSLLSPLNTKIINGVILLFFVTAFVKTDAAESPLGHIAELEASAKKNGAVPIMVTLENVPLSKLSSGLDVVSKALDGKASTLYAELGSNVYASGRWTNNMGQIGFYANQAAIKILTNSGSAKSFQLDPTAKGRSAAFSLDGSLDAIEEVFSTNPFAIVDVILNTDGPPYELLKDGSTRYLGSADATKLVGAILADVGQDGVKILNGPISVATKPIIQAQITRDAFYALKDSKNVRAIRLKNFIDRREIKWPSEALTSAAKFGYVDITISLQGGSSYSTRAALMSENARKYQSEANQRALKEIFSNAGLDFKAPMSEADAFQGVAFARASPDVINKLFQLKDARILSVDTNSPTTSVALINSTGLMNMPSAWLSGYLGAGQTIVVLDSGIRRSHELLKFSGAPKVTLEGCYGTRDYNVNDELNYTSPCPSPDDFGDSTLGLVGSGEPYSNVPFCINRPELCRHGTAIAGAAAGHSSSLIFPNALQGVAPSSALTSISISSYNNANFKQLNFAQDIFKALTANAYGPIRGASNPYTVNMSIASDAPPYYQSNCPSVHTPMTTRIDILKGMGVPVVIPTGNRGIVWGIGWPSCIPNSIKVASVSNDNSGTAISTFSNIASQANFTGQIFFAPGGNGGTTSPNNVTSAYINSDTAIGPSQGTSIAAPQVAGVYATIKSVSQNITVDNATAYMVGSALTISVPLPAGAENYKRVRMP